MYIVSLILSILNFYVKQLFYLSPIFFREFDLLLNHMLFSKSITIFYVKSCRKRDTHALLSNNVKFFRQIANKTFRCDSILWFFSSLGNGFHSSFSADSKNLFHFMTALYQFHEIFQSEFPFLTVFGMSEISWYY